jgi:transposase
MRGSDQGSNSLFSYNDLEARVPKEHPLRLVRDMVNGALSKLDKRFGKLYSKEGRPSIPPERLLRASLLQLFYSIRSERQLMERSWILTAGSLGLGSMIRCGSTRSFPRTVTVC